LSTQPAILTVRELTTHIKRLIDADELLQEVAVRGEISNFTHHASGHMYFSLKDEASQLRCVCFRGPAGSLPFYPANGMQVVAFGNVGVYEKRGEYQLYVRWMQQDGIGALHLAFERLKAKLEAEGLFEPARKRPLPRFPRRVAVATSPTGAAVRDIITVLRRRYPALSIVLIPTIVQGEEAPQSIINSIRLAHQALQPDVLIVGRGGGSLEDLWAFNDEAVARAIFASPVPVVSAVGHETDFTIADFVADVRAPTPSAAAEIVAPDIRELRRYTDELLARGRRAVLAELSAARERLRTMLQRRPFARPFERIDQLSQELDELSAALQNAFGRALESQAQRLEAVGGRLEALGPQSVLKRGYSVCRDAQSRRIVRSVRAVRVGQEIEVLVADGGIVSDVTDVWSAE